MDIYNKCNILDKLINRKLYFNRITKFLLNSNCLLQKEHTKFQIVKASSKETIGDKFNVNSSKIQK
jgi:hypothetical protein